MSKWLFGVGWSIFALGFVIGAVSIYKSSFRFPMQLIVSLIIGGAILIAIGALVKYIEEKDRE